MFIQRVTNPTNAACIQLIFLHINHKKNYKRVLFQLHFPNLLGQHRVYNRHLVNNSPIQFSHIQFFKMQAQSLQL